MRSYLKYIRKAVPNVWQANLASREFLSSLPSSLFFAAQSTLSAPGAAVNNEILHITPKAVEQLIKISGEGELLRVLVDSGGCSGFEYKLSFDKNIHADDEIIEKNGAKVVVDRLSLSFIRGSKLDFFQDLMRSAFRIVDNPVASQGCSCGSSFAPKSML